MDWSKVRLIYFREARDQLRDRRTLFTIFVLPLLLYPLMGASLLQVAQFMREHPSDILVVGAAGLPAEPALLAGPAFDLALAPDPEQRRLLRLKTSAGDAIPALGDPAALRAGDENALRTWAQRAIQRGACDAVLYIPADFADRLRDFQQRLRPGETPAPSDAAVPEPKILYNTASDASRVAFQRLDRVLERWRAAIVQQNLEVGQVPLAATRPFESPALDVAEDSSRRAAMWSKVLPFVLLIWALTGAFYPAVDLCPGEKERGTLETLLCSPALRGEIVWGKLLTIMTFSIATALLNLASMGVTGTFIMRHLGDMGQGAAAMQIGPPPPSALLWLTLAVVPISALFSALSLAIAAFARSSKEGQYYLMPLLLVTLPLMLLPLLPNARLDLGGSIIPVTGAMLLLRALIEGQYLEALRFCLPVAVVTAGGCLLAIRWAIRQFNDESVLFRESERFTFAAWLRGLMRERGPLPTAGEAVLCGVLILVIRSFLGMLLPRPTGWSDFATTMLVTQLAFVAAPPLLMAVMLTRDPQTTLGLRWPGWLALAAGVALALALHPAALVLHEWIHLLYPPSHELQTQLRGLQGLLEQAPNIWLLLLVLAAAPAICEEFAFRGFILSGLRSLKAPWAAIVLSALFFGATHLLLQQSLSAFVLGVVLGWLCARTQSVWPCVLYHVTHNSLTVLVGKLTPQCAEHYPALGWFFHDLGQPAFGYHWPWPLLGLAAAALLFFTLERNRQA